jgi:hypothetical protein
VKEMSSREILDAIRRGVEESARLVAEHKPQHAIRPPLSEQPARSIGEMTPREILEAIDRGLEETSLHFLRDQTEHFLSDHTEHPDSLPKGEEQVPSGRG